MTEASFQLFARTAWKLVQHFGANSEVGMMAYLLASARGKGLGRDDFLTWVAQQWDATEGE